ncbi:TPA: hypothetical protein ACJHGT_003645 [Yersinia enterocolitica]|nr:hypothetical protein [Yersinia enterocolitica]
MTGTGFLLPMVAGAAIGWVSYNVVAHIVSKKKVSPLRAFSLGGLCTLSLVLGVCVFSALSAERPAAKHGVGCEGNGPECYAKTHHNPVRACKQAMDEKATFRHLWLGNEAKPVFGKYFWHDEEAKIIQAFGNQANAINSLGMLTPLQYFCIFNANTGEIIAASFE